MLYEHKTQPVISRRAWYRRLLRSLGAGFAMVGVFLALGIAGYHFVGGIGWIDSVLEASMILSGMGPLAPMQGAAVKLFASAYAILSGFIFLGAAGVVFAPVFHRFLHHFHKMPH